MNYHKIAAALAAGGLALAMTALLPAGAADSFEAIEQSDGTVSIRCTDQELIHADIPETLDGKEVTGLAENCFDGCKSLETVTLPDTLKTIGDYAFQGCALLETVEIPAQVTDIGDFVFEGCTSLESIDVDDENADFADFDGILYSRNGTLLIRYPAAKEGASYTTNGECGRISPWAFTDCRNLQTVTLTSVNAMGADCFMNCKSLQEVTLSDDIEELIGASFARCESLKKIHLPENLKSIGDNCFFGCSALTGIEFPEKLETIGEKAFFGCVGISEMTMPAKVKEIGEQAIGYSVNSEGEPVLIPNFKMYMPAASVSMKYARENGIAYQGSVSQNMVLFVIVGTLLVILLIVGAVTSVRRSRRLAREEAERIAEEEKQKKLAERRAAKKRAKEQKG